MFNQILKGEPITITDPAMTRFMMSLDDALDLVLYAFTNATNGDIFVQKSPASTIETLTQSIKQLMNAPDHPVNVIGTRHGEKLFEVLLSREEMASAQDCGNYFRVTPDLRDLNYEKYVNTGELRITNSIEYSSHNTTRLNADQVVALLKTLELFK
jgi:UDP-glucose 4-epimerase